MMALVAPLTACAPPGQANSPRFASLDRPISENYVQISVVEKKLVEVNASGRPVRAVAPDGFCFPIAGIMTSRDSAFMLLEPCNGDATKGVLSLSIAKHGLFGDDEPSKENFAAFRAFIESNEGARQLGLDAGSGAVFLINTTFEDGVLYAVAKDASGSKLAFSGQIICRAFTEMNGRMVVMSLISSKNGESDPEALRAELAAMVNQMIAENRNLGV